MAFSASLHSSAWSAWHAHLKWVWNPDLPDRELYVTDYAGNRLTVNSTIPSLREHIFCDANDKLSTDTCCIWSSIRDPTSP